MVGGQVEHVVHYERKPFGGRLGVQDHQQRLTLRVGLGHSAHDRVGHVTPAAPPAATCVSATRRVSVPITLSDCGWSVASAQVAA
jgi:hypothetical protein